MPVSLTTNNLHEFRTVFSFCLVLLLELIFSDITEFRCLSTIREIVLICLTEVDYFSLHMSKCVYVLNKVTQLRLSPKSRTLRCRKYESV